jgi:hypothetical protein
MFQQTFATDHLNARDHARLLSVPNCFTLRTLAKAFQTSAAGALTIARRLEAKGAIARV